jgi:hypothetical protein
MKTINPFATTEEETTTPDPDAGRFAIFPGDSDEHGQIWVLRDNTIRPKYDYPFLSREAAVRGMRIRRDGKELIGSPAKRDVYGAPRLGVEVFV